MTADPRTPHTTRMVGSNPVVNAQDAAHEAGTEKNDGKVTRQIFVTGGVASSLGKGLTASSLGMLLRSRGLSVTCLLYTSPSPRDLSTSRMPSSA